MRYPPFCEIILFTASGEKEEKVYNYLLNFRKEFLGAINEEKIGADVFGVNKCAMYKINNKYRYNFMVKMHYSKRMYERIHTILKNNYKDDISIIVDVNPISMY